MPDIRIKDLTTTASSTASDDFFAADGTTNGTRKLSAYSPSFGGNATVGGTLTVSGATINTSGTNAAVKSTDGAVITKVQSVVSTPIGIVGTESNHDLGVYTNNTNRLNISAAGVVAISGTTASTSSSSGALVVSGGVGVAGAGYFGGLLNISSTAGLYAQWKKTDAASGSQSWAWIVDNNGTLFLQAANDNFVGANNYISFTRSGVTPGTTTIHGTTASTGTSSGALVVSGGVGVAGAIYAGGDLTIDKAAPAINFIRGANTNDGLVKFSTGAFGDFGIGHRGTSDSDFHIYSYGTSADALTIAKLSGVSTFGATLVAGASSNAFRITTAQTPASASATGTAGTICWDTSYIYVCTATNTWKRVAIATW